MQIRCSKSYKANVPKNHDLTRNPHNTEPKDNILRIPSCESKEKTREEVINLINSPPISTSKQRVPPATTTPTRFGIRTASYARQPSALLFLDVDPDSRDSGISMGASRSITPLIQAQDRSMHAGHKSICCVRFANHAPFSTLTKGP